MTSLVIPSAYIAYLQKVVLVYGKERFKAMVLAESLRSKLADSSNLMLFIKRTDLYFKLFLAMYFQDAFANLTCKRYEKKQGPGVSGIKHTGPTHTPSAGFRPCFLPKKVRFF